MTKLTLDRTGRRIIGVLIEKELATPAYYPMTLNALVEGANQKNNRDPLTHLQEFEVEGALKSLYLEQWVTNVTQPGARAMKWKHRFQERLALDKREMAVMCELLLRGAQQPGELRAHAMRFHPFAQLEDLEKVVEGLIEKGFVVNLGRKAGERAIRYDHTLYGDDESRSESVANAPSAPRPVEAARSTPSGATETVRVPVVAGDLERRLAALEMRVRSLEARVEELGGGGPET
jgi:uncharacterized protein